MTDKNLRPEVSQQSGIQLYKRLIRYAAPYWFMFVISFLGFALFGASQAWSAKWIEHVINAVKEGNLDQRGLLALMVIGIFLLRGVGSFIGTYSLSHVARQVVHQLRIDLFNHLMSLPGSLYQHTPSGELLAKLTYNVEQVTGAVTEAVKLTLREGLSVIGLFGYLLYLNWKLTLIFLLAAPFLAIAVKVASGRIRMLSRRLQKSVADITSTASESIKGYQEVRIFGGKEIEQKRFYNASNQNRKQLMKMVIAQSLYTPFVQLIIALALALLMYCAMSPSVMGTMDTGSFVAFLTAAGMISKPIRQLTGVSTIIQRGIAACEEVFGMMDMETEKDTGSKTINNCVGHLKLNDLRFTYPGQESPALKGITLDIPAGTSVALVGRSGSGKSTLASIFPRFNDGWQGDVLLDDVPLQDYGLAALREQIALVNQQVVLFNGTIAQNIAYGAMQNASRDEIMAAAKAAHVTEFLERLPNGLDTVVGENGTLLSGGQRQRIAIARAVLKDAPILILDEATSALDTESERHIQAALDEVMKGRTTIVIAHRLSTIEGADKIVVMDSGNILEEGPHAELIAKGGAYANLHAMQFHEEKKREEPEI